MPIEISQPLDFCRLSGRPARGRHPKYDLILYVDCQTGRLLERHNGDLRPISREALADFVENSYLVEEVPGDFEDDEYTGAEIYVKLLLAGKPQEFRLTGDTPDEVIAKFKGLQAKYPQAEVVELDRYFDYVMPRRVSYVYEDGSIDELVAFGDCRYGDELDAKALRELGVRHLADVTEDLFYEASFDDCFNEDIARYHKLEGVTLYVADVLEGKPPRGHTGSRRLRLKLPSGRRIGVSFIRR